MGDEEFDGGTVAVRVEDGLLAVTVAVVEGMKLSVDRDKSERDVLPLTVSETLRVEEKLRDAV